MKRAPRKVAEAEARGWRNGFPLAVDRRKAKRDDKARHAERGHIGGAPRSSDCRATAAAGGLSASPAKSSLRRKKPLRAKRWGIRWQPPRRLTSARNDTAFRAWVRTLPCIAAAYGPCEGPIDPSHVATGAGQKGTGMKVPDDQVVPHCRKHHDEWDRHRGAFKGLARDERREIAARWVAETRARYGAREAA